MKKLRLIISGILAVTLTIGAGSGPAFLQTAQAASKETSGPDSTDTIEGEGFATPEEAILAFTDALKAGDLNQMLSTFAIESYCDHFSMVDQAERILVLNIRENTPVASDDSELMEQISVYERSSNITKSIKNALLTLSANRMTLSSNENYRKAGNDIQGGVDFLRVYDYERSEIEDIISALQDIPDFSGMTAYGPVSMSALSHVSGSILHEPSLSSMFKSAMVAGADGYTERGMILEDEDEIYFITMDIVRYGEKWYNYMLGGQISTLLGSSLFQYGIMGVDLSAAGDEYDDEGMSMEDFQGIKNLVAASKLLDSSEALQWSLKKNASEFNREHEELIELLKSEKDSSGNSLDMSSVDFSKPLIDQMDVLKTAADKNGLNFYSNNCDFTKLTVMTFEELIDFFAL